MNTINMTTQKPVMGQPGLHRENTLSMRCNVNLYYWKPPGKPKTCPIYSTHYISLLPGPRSVSAATWSPALKASCSF